MTRHRRDGIDGVRIREFLTARGIARLLGVSVADVKAKYGMSDDTYLSVSRYPEIEAVLVAQAVTNKLRRRRHDD